MPKTALKMGMSRILFLQFLFSSIHAWQKIGEKPLQKYSASNIYVGREILFSVTIFFFAVFVIKMKKIKKGWHWDFYWSTFEPIRIDYKVVPKDAK